jgi:hypothetical protein
MFIIDEDNFVLVYKSGVYREFKAMNFGHFFYWSCGPVFVNTLLMSVEYIA